MFRLTWPSLLFALFWLIGCGDKTEVKVSKTPSPAADKPVSGDWLVVHSLSDPEQLNPLTSNDSASSAILQYIFQSLLTRDPRTLELKPLIAERPAISADKLTYTFKIRRDARFQDGRPLTGEDVLFSIKAIKCPLVNAPFLRVYFNSVIDARLVDPFTIEFKIREPYFLNESVLGGIDVLPRHYYDPENLLKNVSVADLGKPVDRQPENVKRFADNFNKNYSRNPMGSGPYKLASWKTGREIELVRDLKYWGYGKPGVDQPYIDKQIYRIINNMDAALVTLKSGGLDEMGLTPIQHVRGTSSERFKREFQKYEYFAPNYTYIGWNNDHPIFRDSRVRRAMTYFTNRRQMVKSILFGLGEIVEGPIYFFRPEYDKSLPSYPFDPQKALELLKEAGWRDTDGDGILDKTIDGRKVPFRFEIKINSGNTTRKSVALTLQDELKKHGIEASVREIDWTIFLSDVKAHKFDAVILGWSMSVSEPDAYQVWHSSQAANGGSNHISYKNARVDRILEQYRREFDPKKRIELYREFQRILSDEQPYTFLFVNKSLAAVQRRFHGIEVFPGGIRPIDWWVPKALQRYGQEAVN
ncbi:MAG TPA: peptide-binding protein [Methylomirabilota bacterium]|nr:peptide-binding protein [Methylomirabilota bacterium]